MFHLEIKPRKGTALLLVILIFALFMVLGAILLKIVYNASATSSLLFQGEQAFWLAEAGLEAGRVALVKNPGWYTDLPHYPEDDVKWLRLSAVGQKENLGNGWFKIVREKDGNCLYSVGSKGEGAAVLKIELALFPLKVLKWEEL